ncbi:MAG: hypothetical protein GY861_15930 [bacterium]|nr:hypothetical protein [bacterium]
MADESILDKDNPFMPKLLGGTAQVLETYYDFNAPEIDYDILNLQADFKDTQADAIDLRATEEANRLRNDFSEAVGQYTAGAARRGVKVDSGSVRANIEGSAKAVGEDIQTVKESAEFKKSQLELEKKRLETGAEDIREINRMKRLSKLVSGVGKTAALFK